MSLRLTRKGFITSLSDLPEMRSLAAYMAGRRAFRDDGGHGGGTGGDSGGGDDDTGDDDADAEDDDSEEEDDDTKNAKGKKKDKDDDEDEEVVPKWKYDRLHARMQAADRNQTDLRKQLDDIKNSKDVPAEVKRELDEVKAKVATVEGERDKAIDRANALTIKLAATTMTGDGMPEWANIETALRLADLSDVEVSDDGKVDKRALKSALKQLAKDHPYLLKPKAKNDDGTGNEQGDGTGGTSKMNGKRRGERQTPTREALAQRFPVLNAK